MDYEHPEIVEVSQEETAMILWENEIQRKANIRAKKEAEEASKIAGRLIRAPMTTVEDPDERRIVNAVQNLKKRYQEERGLSQLPILIPNATCRLYSFPQVTTPFHPYYRKDTGQLSQMELMELFLERTAVRKQGDMLYVWNGMYFYRANDGEMRGLIAEVLREELRRMNASTTIGAILSLLQSERRIQVEPDIDSDNIALRNGTLDHMSLQFGQSDPRIFNTYFLDAYWYWNASCPAFQFFLSSISGGNSVLSRRILEVFGFLLAPGNKAKRFVLFQGVPNSGKSVLGNLLQSFFLPGDVSSVPLHQLGDRFAMSAVAGRHLNLSMDLPSGVIDGRSASIIKQITGGDLVFVEGKGKEGHTKHIQCKFLFGTNHRVELKVRDEAFAQRILLVPFRISVPENQRDTGLLDKLRQEKAGILYQSLAAYREVVQRNYHFSGEEEFGFKLQEIVLPTQPIESVRVFVEGCCRLATDTFTTTEALHQAFLMFCQQTGLPSISDRSAFSRTLKSLLGNQIEPTKKRVGGTPLNGYTGIKLTQ